MEDKSIYLGNQVPCSVHALKSLLNKDGKHKIFLSLEKRNFEFLNLMLWSKVELDLVLKYLNSINKIKENEFKVHLNIFYNSNTIRFGSDGGGNLVELIRFTGVGVHNFNNLVKLHEGFYRTYYKFMSDIINFGQYNTSIIQNFLDKLPKSYKSFYDELYESKSARELLLKICLIFGGDERLIKNKNSTMLLVSKVLSGVYLVDFNHLVEKVFPNQCKFKHLDCVHIKNLGKKTSKISFDGYEGEEISLFENLNASDIFDSSYLADKSLYPLGQDHRYNFYGNNDVAILSNVTSLKSHPAVLKNNRFRSKRGFVDEFRGASTNDRVCISGVEFNHLKYVETNGFAIGPYLTYLFSSN